MTPSTKSLLLLELQVVVVVVADVGTPLAKPSATCWTLVEALREAIFTRSPAQFVVPVDRPEMPVAITRSTSVFSSASFCTAAAALLAPRSVMSALEMPLTERMTGVVSKSMPASRAAAMARATALLYVVVPPSDTASSTAPPRFAYFEVYVVS